MITVIRRDDIDGLPLGWNGIMCTWMTRNIAVFRKGKEAGNFCASFEFKATEPNIVDEAATARAKLDALFNKLK